MVTSSPNCTNRHRAGYTCLELGKSMDECCRACQDAGAERILRALYPDKMKEIEDEEPGDIGPDDVGPTIVASFDLPSSSFPFDIIFINKETQQVWHRIHVTSAGDIDIPAAKQHGIAASEVIIQYADGTIIRTK